MGVFSNYFHKVKGLSRFDQVEDLFGFVGYESDYYIMDGGGMATVFVCSPAPGPIEKQKNALDAIFNKEYPANTTIQTQLVAVPDVSYFMQQFETTRGNRLMGNDNELTTSMAESLANDIEGKVFKDMCNGARVRDFEFWFTIRVPTAEQLPNSREEQRYKELIVDVEEGLRSGDFFPAKAKPEHLLWRLQSLFNPSKDALWRNPIYKPNNSRSFASQILEDGNSFHFTPNGIVTGKPNAVDEAGGLEFEKDNQTHIRMMSLVSTFEELHFGQMLDLVSDYRYGNVAHGDPFMISTLMLYPEQSKARSDISNSRNWLIGQAKGKLLEWFQGLAAQKQDYDQMWNELDEKKRKVVFSGTHVTTFSATAESADRTVAKMIRYFETSKVTFTKESVLTGPLFFQTVPCMMDKDYANFRRHSIYSSEAMSYLTPHMSSWKGNTHLPIVPMTTRNGQIFFWDLFKTDGGFNFMLSAKTGSGKSVLVNYIVNCYLNSGVKTGGSLLRKPHEKKMELVEFDDGAQVFVLDSGRSYQNLAEMFQDSQFIAFDGGFKYSLNPFKSIHSWSSFTKDGEEHEGQGPMILTMFKAMAAPKHGVSELQRAEMMTLLTNMWNEYGQESTVTMFVNMCLEHELEEMRQIGMQLRIFAEGGIYGELFSNKYPPIDFNGRLVVIELEELQNDIHLQLVAILSIISQIQHKIFQGGTARRSLFLLEEAWQWMTGEKDGDKGALVEFVGDYLQAAFRKFRKVRAAGGVISQRLMDFTMNPVGHAIMANTDWKLFLEQDASAIDTIRENKAFSASDHQFELMKSVRTKKGSYSEIMIFHQQMSEICRLELEPETLMIFSTDPDDRELMKKYRALGNDVKEAARLSVLEKQR